MDLVAPGATHAVIGGAWSEQDAAADGVLVVVVGGIAGDFVAAVGVSKQDRLAGAITAVPASDSF